MAGLAVGMGLVVLFAAFAPSMPSKNNTPNAAFMAFAGCSQSPATSGHAVQIQLKERTWVSVARLSTTPKLGGKEKCTTVSQELLARLPALA